MRCWFDSSPTRQFHMDYDDFTTEEEGSVIIRTYYKDGQIVGQERETRSYRPHPFVKPEESKEESKDEWPEVIH